MVAIVDRDHPRVSVVMEDRTHTEEDFAIYNILHSKAKSVTLHDYIQYKGIDPQHKVTFLRLYFRKVLP